MVSPLGFDSPGADQRFRILTDNVPAEKPLAMQVYGREPALCAEAARRLDQAGADIIDLNCGCPVKKAKQSGCGVALMREPEQVGRVVAAMCAVTNKPVTVKMRLGFDQGHRNALEVAQAAVANGAKALFVHARTGESKHGQAVELEGVAQVKAAVQVPVIANGSMDTAEAIRRAKDEAGVDGYQIGRSACGDPWLFRNLVAELTGGERYWPSYDERRLLLERHFRLIIQLFGEQRGTRVMRKYTFFYCNGLPGVRRFRDRFMRIESVAQFHELVEDFFGHLAKGLEQGDAEHLTLFDRASGASEGVE